MCLYSPSAHSEFKLLNFIKYNYICASYQNGSLEQPDLNEVYHFFMKLLRLKICHMTGIYASL